jgi:hypothetical protein
MIAARGGVVGAGSPAERCAKKVFVKLIGTDEGWMR